MSSRDPAERPGGERPATHPSTAAESDAGRTRTSGTVYFCDLCGAPMLDLHCKLICQRCGYRRDCSDP